MPNARRSAASNIVRDALSSSLDLPEAFRAALPALLQAVDADSAAVGRVAAAEPGGFQWIPLNVPPAFFASYQELAPDDFVLRAVSASPNRALRDQEMISRRGLESSIMYRRLRDLDAPVEHVMSAMLQDGSRPDAGISFYRRRRRPFSDRQRDWLQEIMPALANTVRNCRRFEQSVWRSHSLECLLADDEHALIAFDRSGRELARTSVASGLIDRWFPSAGRSPAATPGLFERVQHWLARGANDMAQCTRRGAALLARGGWVLRDGVELLVVRLEEVPVRAPERRLTRRERAVVSQVMAGHGNRFIGEQLGCSEATVKKHLQHVYEKLGVESRAQLIVRLGKGAVADPVGAIDAG